MFKQEFKQMYYVHKCSDFKLSPCSTKKIDLSIIKSLNSTEASLRQKKKAKNEIPCGILAQT